MAPSTTNPPILIPRTPTTPLEPLLRTSLQSALLNQKTIRTLRTTLETETQAAAWQEKVKLRTLQLLGEKEYWKWEELCGVIVGEARGEEEGEEDDENENERGEVDRRREDGGKGKGIDGPGRDGERAEEKVDIRIPEKAITEAAKVVKGVLEKKVELEPEGKGFWD